MGEFPPRGRQSRGTTRERKLLLHVPAALWECWDPCYWWTYQRHCVNAEPKGSTQERAPPLGNQPENWWAERRSFVSGIPVVFFNAASAPEQVSQVLYMVSAYLVRHRRGLTSTVQCPRSLLLSLYYFLLLLLFFSPRFSFLCSLTAALRFGRFFSLRHIWADHPWTPRRRLPGPWPAAWTRGGVELDCELNVSYGFSFVESGCVDDDRPSYPRVKGCAPMWTGMDCGYCHENLVLLLSTVSRCGGVLAWLPGGPVLSRQYRL